MMPTLQIAPSKRAAPSVAAALRAPSVVRPASRRDELAPPAGVSRQAAAAIATSGEPLEAGTRRTMEVRFGHDFGAVRVHTGKAATEATQAASARAYTVGQHIAFGENEYRPGTAGGTELLAHELAHTVQQRGGSGAAPATGADSEAERSAESAARDVGSGRAVQRPLPACQVGLARNVVPLDAYDDAALANEIARLTKQLKEGDPASRDWYRDRLRQATAIAATRKRAREPVPPPVPAPPPPPVEKAPPPRDEAAERAQAVKEAEAVLAERDDDDREEAPAPVSMHLGPGGGRARPSKKGASLPTTLSLVQPDPRWQEGVRVEQELKDQVKADHERIDKQIAHDRELSRTSYDERLRRVRLRLQQNSSYWYSYNEAVSRMNGEEVWSMGLSMDLFLESEKKAVYADQGQLQKLIEEEMHEKARQIRTQFEIDQYRAHVARGEELSSPAMFVQPFAFGAMGPLIGAAYAGTQTGGMVGQAYNACVKGSAGDCVAAAGPLVVAAALHRATRTPGAAGESRAVVAGENPVPVAAPAPAPQPARQIAGLAREIEPKPAVTGPAERQVAGFARPLEPNPTPGPEPTIGFKRTPRPGGSSADPAVTSGNGDVVDMPPARVVSSSGNGGGPQTGQVRTTITGAREGEHIRAGGGKGPGDTPKVETGGAPKTSEPAPKPTAGGVKPATEAEKPGEASGAKATNPAGAPKPGAEPAAAPKRLISPEQLNDLVPQRKGITGPKRRLSSEERKTANEIIDALEDVNRGDAAAMNRVMAYRPHQHTTGDMAGWWSVDLIRGNPGALNIMRLYFRKGKSGALEAVVRQGH